MRNVILWEFWPCLSFGQPRVDQEHLGWEMHFECYSVQTSCTMPLYMFLWPHGEKMIFLGFSASDTQIKGEQNMISTPPSFCNGLGTICITSSRGRTIDLTARNMGLELRYYFGKVLGIQNCPTLRLASSHCVLCLMS